MKFASILPALRKLVSDNSSAILTSLGVTGTVTTAYLTGKASFKAAETIRIANLNLRHETDGHGVLSLRDKFDLVWRDYIPAAGAGVTTISCVIMANRLQSREAAALAAAYGLTERAFAEYKEKVVEKIGNTKERAVRDGIAQDRLKSEPVVAKDVIITGGGDVLCKDAISGRYFLSSHEKVQKAANDLNFELIHHMSASLSRFYELLGLEPTDISDEIGWNSDKPLELSISSGMSSDDRPCMVVGHAVMPFPYYTRLF